MSTIRQPRRGEIKIGVYPLALPIQPPSGGGHANSSNGTRCCETTTRERCIVAALAPGAQRAEVHQGRSAGPLPPRGSRGVALGSTYRRRTVRNENWNGSIDSVVRNLTKGGK